MSQVKDLTGQRFGKLVVLKRIKSNKDGRTCWSCICDCGNIKEVKGHDLTSGRVKSCGCLRHEATAEFNRKTKRKYNEYDLTKEYGIGFATNDGAPFYFDLEDYEKIKDMGWRTNAGYISSRQNGKEIMLHWFIMGRKYIDHKNGNGYDNRKENLRPYDNWENNMNRKTHKNNTSGYTGVRRTEYKGKQKWQAHIQVRKKCISLGAYVNIEDAVKVRKEAEEKYFGEWRNSN